MTVTFSSELAFAPGDKHLVASRFTRSQFFAGLYFLACVNGLLGRLILSMNFDSWATAITGLDINAVVLFACFAGLSLLLADRNGEPIRRSDVLVAIPFLALVALPIFALSWIAVTCLSLYVLFVAKGGPDQKRAAIVLLALSVPMLWSRLLFQFFAKPILDIDAALVAALLGTQRIGNVVQFADGDGYMVVLAACSSLANMSLAFLCWISITQWVKHQWTRMDLVWSLLACVSVIAVNVSRISLMGINRNFYEAIHSENGDLVVNSIMLVLMVGVSLLGVRREIFARH